MQRKILVGILLIMFVFSNLAFAQNGPEMNLMDKVIAIEKVFYGTEQTGSLVDRTAKLEKDIYGIETKDALMTKLDRLYAYTKENSNLAPSFIMKLNAVEWALTHDTTVQPAKARLENLEHVLIGTPSAGAFDDRLSKLIKLAYNSGYISGVNSILPKDTLVKIKIVTPLNSKTSRVGDTVEFQAAEDIYAAGNLVIAKGAQGFGKVTKVEQAKNFGRDAKLEIAFTGITAIDGRNVLTTLGEKAKEETKSLAKAAGATAVGLAVLGPIGVVGGAFVRGQDIDIQPGVQMFIQTAADAEVFGLQASQAISH